MPKALFLDRDGVIHRDVGYAHRPEQIAFRQGIFDLSRAARAQGYLLIVVTNQAGIGRGLYTEEDFHALMRWMGERFAAEGAPLAAYYFCPHHPQHGLGEYRRDCDCRKPKPGMFLRVRDEWAVDMAASLMIGDKESDMQAAADGGVGRCVLCSGSAPLSEALLTVK